MKSARGKRFFLVAAILMAMTIGVASLAVAQGKLLEGFIENDDYLLEIDGQVDSKAQIFLKRSLPAFLVLPSGSNSPWLLSIRSRVVQSINIMKMTQSAGGVMDLASDAILGTKGSLQQSGGSFSFSVDGTQYVLAERPVKLGLTAALGLEEYAANYRDGAKAYSPDAAALKTIRAAKGKVHVRVYHGSWCGFCKRYVPHMVRVANEIDESNITIDFYGLPKDITSDPVAKQARVNSVPTAVIFVDGKEIGRLAQDDWRAPEKALAKALK